LAGNRLVITDEVLVGPIIRRMFEEVGKPNANVRVCQDPLLGGIFEALRDPSPGRLSHSL